LDSDVNHDGASSNEVKHLSRDGQRVERMLWANNSIDKSAGDFSRRDQASTAPPLFDPTSSRMLEEWPTIG
jgi:hypothetical protein